jgi:hypothetical protein
MSRRADVAGWIVGLSVVRHAPCLPSPQATHSSLAGPEVLPWATAVR